MNGKTITANASPDGKVISLHLALEGREPLALQLTPDTANQLIAALGQGLDQAAKKRGEPTGPERAPEKLVKRIRIGTDASTGTKLIDLQHIDGTATQYLVGKDHIAAILEELHRTIGTILSVQRSRAQ